MSKKLPYFKFFPGDWLKDTRCLSPAAKGAWIDILSGMWDSQIRGVLTMPLVGYARMVGATVDQTAALIDELTDFGICERSDEGKNIVLTSRRMQREGHEMEAQAEAEAERQRQAYLKRKSKDASVVSTSSQHVETVLKPEIQRVDNVLSPIVSTKIQQPFTDVRQMSDSDSDISEIHTEASAPVLKPDSWRPPTLDEVLQFARGPHGLASAKVATAFWHHYDGQGWIIGNGQKMSNWQSKFINYKNNRSNYLRTDSPNKPLSGKSGTSLHHASAQIPETTIKLKPPVKKADIPF